jgi:signal peptidase II
MTDILQATNQKKSMLKRAWLVIILALVIDQIIKIWVKTTLPLEGHVNLLGEYFQIYFIENKGMAFGMHFGDNGGKIALTLFRVIACGVIMWFLYDLAKKSTDKFKMTVFALIFAGAAGNTIDCILYGAIFSESNYTQVATLFPSGGGYGSLLKGRVVDMFLYTGRWPSSAPGVGGNMIFPPIFNFADSCISVGVIMLLLWQKRFFGKKKTETKPTEA